LRRNHTKNIDMRILVIRTSAMGDVALIIPVIRGLKRQFPDVELVILTRPAYKSFFTSIEGISLFSPDLTGKHKGFFGIIQLFADLRKSGEFDRVIDLHDVLRSKILRVLFRLRRVPVTVINKGRKDKRAVINGKNKSGLIHSVDRYRTAFKKAGFSFPAVTGPWIIPSSEALKKAGSMTETPGSLNIGVAPFAKHKLKMWPEKFMITLLELISEKHKTRFWLFGGDEDTKQLELFQAEISGSFNVAGKLNLDEELALMSRLDLMIAMDSSNMHMAALVGTKVISIWGGTDPLSGFGAWMQPENYSISVPIDELNCRPCTTYGKGSCRRGDFACMNWLTPEMVFEKMNNLKIW